MRVYVHRGSFRMRKLLATAAALAPLMVASGVQAQVVISTSRTTPILTSNATGTAADNIRITSGGGTVVTTGSAVIIDSSNTVVMESGSVINVNNAPAGGTGIQINGGVTTNLTMGGQIVVTDNLTPTDTDNDGDLDGPFASGTDRYGIRMAGAGAITGNILIESTGAIQVEGNNSYGVSLETALTGNLTSFGSIRVVGENTIGVRVSGPVTGAVNLAGTLSATGQGATAVSIQNNISGRLTLQGEISSTGYRYTGLGNDAFVGRLDPDDLLQNSSAVIIAGDVGGGVVLDIPPLDTDPNSTDDDGDGRADTLEGSSVINSFGAAPAVTVGSATRSVTLGVAGTGTNAYGFINRGQLLGQGVYDGVQGNALRFGVAGGQTVNVAGGILNQGTIGTLATNASAVAVRLGAGVTTPVLVNNGTLTAGAAASGNTEVTGVRIEAGANLPALTNDGSLLATAGSGTATVTGVLDLSGSLRTITNTGSIQATLVPSTAGAAITGTATALDLRANTSGVTFTQRGIASTATPTDRDSDGDGVTDSNEPIMAGAILLGAGADVVNFQNGLAFSDISFGAGADQLNITGGAVVRGALSDSDGLLNVNIANGTLDARQQAPLTISGLNVGADGTLIVTLDPANRTNSGFRVNGTATLADGAGLGIRFTSLLQSAQRFNVIDANTLNFGAIDTAAVQANSPYLFVVNAGANVAAGDVYIDARRRTAAEADLITVESQAFDAFYAALDDDSALLNAFLSQTDRDGFINLYEQILPDHSGGPLLSLASGVDAVTRALTGRNASATPGETSAWLQEINFYADKDKTDTYGFRSEGFGVAGGVERGTSLGAFGVSLAFTSSDLEDPEAEAEEVLSANLVELGLYWRAQGQHWTTWARAAAGYATFDATRAFVGSGLNLSNESTWNGFTLAMAGGASFERNLGRFNIRPEGYVEYFGLSESARGEEGGGDGFDLDIDERDGHMFSAVAAVNLGYGFGENGWIRPELRLGWRQNISVDVGDTIARFASGGPDFTLNPTDIEGGGPIAGVRLSVGNELGMLSINADAEMIEDYVRYTLLLRASFRF